MAEPHTHGGTDAPECTTCRNLEAARAELDVMIEMENARHMLAVSTERRLHEHSIAELKSVFSRVGERIPNE